VSTSVGEAAEIHGAFAQKTTTTNAVHTKEMRSHHVSFFLVVYF
jgi:hypothetical protein